MKIKLFIILNLIACIYAQFLNLDSNCGRGTNKSVNYKIVGGVEAKLGDWGWQILLNYFDDDGNVYTCGGSLISSEWILTAAHCVDESDDPSDYKVGIGLHNRQRPNSWSLVRQRVAKVIKHSKYNTKNLFNDIALIKLSKPIVFDTTGFKVVPVCIPTLSRNFQSKYGYATGWGDLYENAGEGSKVLREVALPILSDTSCRLFALDKTSPVNTVTQICAGRDGGNKDTCQGDSGGPLVSRGNDGRWYLVGITSYGYGCGNTGVYTRTSAYQDWILSNIN